MGQWSGCDALRTWWLDMLRLENAIVLSLTETWVHSGILESIIKINGFSLFRSDQDTRMWGEVEILYKRKKKYK